MDCQRHNRANVPFCPECEREQDERDVMAYDDYDRMPFGDAIRMEDEAVFQDLAAGEGRDWDEYSAEHPDDDHEEFPSDFQDE